MWETFYNRVSYSHSLLEKDILKQRCFKNNVIAFPHKKTPT